MKSYDSSTDMELLKLKQIRRLVLTILAFLSIFFPSLIALEEGVGEDVTVGSKPGFKIDMSDKLKNCGSHDRCVPQQELSKLRKMSDVDAGTKNMFFNLFKCNCDEAECLKYGDCCSALFFKVTTKTSAQAEIPWRCHFLQNHGRHSIGALMISKCAGTSKNPLCTKDNPKELQKIPKSRRYLLNLPVYSTKNHVLYKNIYCAECNNEHNDDFLQLHLQLVCNHDFNEEERKAFQEQADYYSFDRSWRRGNSTCKLIIDEFSEQNLSSSIPGIRYCGYTSIDSCPQNDESILHPKIRSLCSSYTQYVSIKVEDTTQIYKNPHCVLCNRIINNITRRVQCTSSLFRILDPPGVPDNTVGLHFLFDFNLSNENQHVGYEMLCEEDEVWDYIRQRCHPMICGKDHLLVDGSCQLISKNGTIIEYEDHDDEDISDENNDDSSEEEDLNDNPECFRILIHENEYQILPEQNNTIVINLSTGAWIYLEENEYEIWNETTVSICAKYLHLAFQSRFSPILKYLSVILVGISVGFLFIHLLLYILLPKLRNLPSQNLFCLTLSLFIAQFLFLLFITSTDNQGLCILVGILIHYFFLSSFFWMSSMSFDIWRTFTGQTLSIQGRSNSGRSSTFIKYSIFSWGGALLIIILAISADFVEDDSLDFLRLIRPEYGHSGLCWISQRLSLFIFFALPVGLVIFTNLIFFSLTAKAIAKQNQESNRVLQRSKDSSKSSSKDEIRLKLYIKLALIMGVTWILGFLSPLLLWEWLWYAFVILNGLQGTFIFFAFDFKRKTFGLLKDALGLRNRKESSTTTGSAGSSGTSSAKPNALKRGTKCLGTSNLGGTSSSSGTCITTS